MGQLTPVAPVPTATLLDAFEAAFGRRGALLSRLLDEGTDAVRLLHGAMEGCPGVTVDRYGPMALVQTGRAPLEAGAVARLQDRLGLPVVWNHRPAFRKEGFDAHHPLPGSETELDLRTVNVHEGGLVYRSDPRHGGLDPLLFLDLRAGRRRVRALASGARVLNLFAYTCGLGVAAAAGGASEVVNVDFARSALTVGAENARINGFVGPWFRLVHEDVFPVIRQLAGLAVKGRGARRPYLRLPARSFDLVVLDPPRWARTPYGAVDVVRDYPSLFKPALLATAPGGHVLATNHVPKVALETFLAVLRRTAQKIGRSLEAVEVVVPDADFPSADGQPPLKVVVARVD